MVEAGSIVTPSLMRKQRAILHLRYGRKWSPVYVREGPIVPHPSHSPVPRMQALPNHRYIPIDFSQ